MSRWCRTRHSVAGLLTGAVKVDPDATDDVRNTMTHFQGANGEANHALLAPLRKIATVHGATVAQVALAWVHQRSAVWQTAVVPIPGTRSRTRVEENLGALKLTLDEAELAALEPFAAEVSGARWDDPQEAHHGGTGDFPGTARKSAALVGKPVHPRLWTDENRFHILDPWPPIGRPR